MFPAPSAISTVATNISIDRPSRGEMRAERSRLTIVVTTTSR
jgi:hypothetical protein